MRKSLFLILGAICPYLLNAQKADSTDKKTSIQVFPSLSYQQETGLQFGAHTVFYFDIAKDDSTSRRSKVETRLYYTTRAQYYTLDIWQLFTKDEGYNINGQFQAGYWIDRFYSIGNNPSSSIVTFQSGKPQQALPYANYSYNFANLYSVFDKKIYPNTFSGLFVEYDNAGKNQFLADSVQSEGAINLNRNNAVRSGIGFNLNYDTRDNYDNPLSGTYVQLVSGLYRKEFGGSTDYHTVTMDADKYINTTKMQTLALRLVVEYRKPDGSDPIPLRGLSYNGGISSVRGYYAGTFRDNDLVAFESEYRLPISINPAAPYWKFWERFGMVFFLSTVKVSDHFSGLTESTAGFHFAGGAGFRYMVNMKQRLNIAIDYAVGFDPVEAGSRPSGLYFNLAEAF